MTWKKYSRDTWQRWFAWYPVRYYLPYRKNAPAYFAWLQTIERRQIGTWSNLAHPIWEYRLLSDKPRHKVFIPADY